MKNLVAIILSVFCALISYSQSETTPKTPFTKEYLAVWNTAKDHCLDIAKTMPEDLYSYKPTPLSKSFAEQMVHIAYTIPLLTKRYVQGMKVRPIVPNASKMTKADIINLLEDGFAYTTNVIYNIELEQLEETCVMYHSGNTVSRAFALFMYKTTMANHRAKANLYLRINGIVPPEYTW